MESIEPDRITRIARGQEGGRGSEGTPEEGDKKTTRRSLGSVSVVIARISASLHAEAEAGQRLGAKPRPESQQERRPRMPIMLATSGKGEGAKRVQAMLDKQGIAYSVVFVETYDRPRLQVGSAELVGEAQIAAHLAEILELSHA